MKKLITAGLAAAMLAGTVNSQETLISGFVEFEGYALDDIDADSRQTSLDSAVDAALIFDHSRESKAGLRYGMHLELDMFQSDDDKDGENIIDNADIVAGDQIDFNDGYVFLDSALGYVALGDTGTAGQARNQIRVPLLPLGAVDRDDYSNLELEQVFYANSYAGLSFEGSVDDDADWSVGAQYDTTLGPWGVTLGGALHEDGGAGSLSMALGDLSAGLHLAGTTANRVAGGTVTTAQTYVSMGVDYNLGALKLGLGTESEVTYLYSLATSTKSKDTVQNFFAGAIYEMADGLELGMGVGLLDADSALALKGTETVSGKATVTVHF